MTRLGVAAIALAGMAALFYANWPRDAEAPDNADNAGSSDSADSAGPTDSADSAGSATLSEALVREALATRFGVEVEVEWREFAVSLNPASVALGDVRAVWSREPGWTLRADAVVLRPDPVLFGRGVLELRSSEFRELRIELSGAPTARSLALRELEVWRADTEAIRGSGSGEFGAGGTLHFEWSELRGADGMQIEVRISDVPADAWAALVPELRDATGTISGQLFAEIAGEGVASEAPGEASRGAASIAPIEGRFEIDATHAGLVVGGAYRKPVGDPATLAGRFMRGPEGDWELVKMQLSVRKAKGGSADPSLGMPGKSAQPRPPKRSDPSNP